MKKYVTLFLGVAALMATSCSQEPFAPEEPTGKPVTLRATIEGATSRTAINDGKVNWLAEDNISVRLSDGSNLTMTVASGAGSTEATFTGVIVGEKKLNVPTVAVYPAGDHNLTDGSIRINMPATYNVENNNNTNLPMICNFNNEGVGTFSHLGGVIEFKIGMDYVPTGAAKFRFTTRDKQNITGNFSVVDGAIAATDGDGSQSSVTITFNKAQIVDNVLTVNVPLPVGEYVGMDLDILDAEDNQLMKTFGSDAKNNVERAKRVVMPKLTPVEISAGTEGEDDVTEEADGSYTINTAAGVAEMYNLMVNTTKAIVFNMKENKVYDMTDIAYGNSTAGFDDPHPKWKVTINGNGATITNLSVSGLQATLIPWTGSGIEITNLTMKDCTFTSTNEDTNCCCAAAFGSFCDICAVTISGCTLDNVTVGGGKYTGGFVAFNTGTATMTNCKVTNSHINSNYTEDGGENYKGHAGGFFGRCSNVAFDNCGVEYTTFNIQGPRGGIFCGTQNDGAITGNGYVRSNVTGALPEDQYYAPGFLNGTWSATITVY